MRPVRRVLGSCGRACGRGLRAYWKWLCEASESIGSYYQPW
ncbi:hypothetical protein [Alicyclobacillus kakegawensis]|nr:hypothetical protein [Alicyclobacillus kakegawensis]